MFGYWGSVVLRAFGESWSIVVNQPLPSVAASVIAFVLGLLIHKVRYGREAIKPEWERAIAGVAGTLVLLLGLFVVNLYHAPYLMHEEQKDAQVQTAKALKAAETKVSELKQQLTKAERPIISVVESFLVVDTGLLAVSFENNGRSIAREVRAGWKVFVNGVEAPSVGADTMPRVLMPKGGGHFEAHLPRQRLKRVLAGEDTLEVRVGISYDDDFDLFRYSYSYAARFVKARQYTRAQQLVVTTEHDKPQPRSTANAPGRQ